MTRRVTYHKPRRDTEGGRSVIAHDPKVQRSAKGLGAALDLSTAARSHGPRARRHGLERAMRSGGHDAE